MNCSTCAHYVPIVKDGDEPKGNCRRYPPVFYPSAQASLFPPVRASMVCGEYAPGRVTVLKTSAVGRTEVA